MLTPSQDRAITRLRLRPRIETESVQATIRRTTLGVAGEITPAPYCLRCNPRPAGESVEERISHGICSDCVELYLDEIEKELPCE